MGIDHRDWAQELDALTAEHTTIRLGSRNYRRLAERTQPTPTYDLP